MKASPKSSPEGKDLYDVPTNQSNNDSPTKLPPLQGRAGERLMIQLITAVVLCAFGCAMLVAGFWTPPIGELHHSILIAFGEILTFSGSLIGIDYKYRYKR